MQNIVGYLCRQTWSFVSHRNPWFSKSAVLKIREIRSFQNLQNLQFSEMCGFQNMQFLKSVKSVVFTKICGFCNYEVWAFHQVKSFKRKTNNGAYYKSKPCPHLVFTEVHYDILRFPFYL